MIKTALNINDVIFLARPYLISRLLRIDPYIIYEEDDTLASLFKMKKKKYML